MTISNFLSTFFISFHLTELAVDTNAPAASSSSSVQEMTQIPAINPHPLLVASASVQQKNKRGAETTADEIATKIPRTDSPDIASG